MFRKNAWRWAAVAVSVVLGPAAAPASEPPSSKVARWHDEWCPRDLTPIVTGPCYGYYPTRWRVMPPCDPPIPLTLPAAAVPFAGSATPTANRPAGKAPAVGPSPYGAPFRPVPVLLPATPPKGGWTARPAAGQVMPASTPTEPKRLPRPDERELPRFPPAG